MSTNALSERTVIVAGACLVVVAIELLRYSRRRSPRGRRSGLSAKYSFGSAPPFGEELAAAAFDHHDPRVLRLNNGSFGAAPAVVMEAAATVRARWLAEPDRWWLTFLGPGLDASSASVAAQFGLEKKDVSVVDNLTVASTIVGDWLVSSALSDKKEHDISEVVVLLSSFTYNAVKNVFLAAQAKLAAADVTLVIESVELPFPIESEAQLMEAFGNKLDALVAEYEDIEGACLKLACLDHISSLPACVFPVDKLVPLCRARGFERVFVDGAHAPGTMTGLDIPALDADFYVANLHKWMFAATAAAFIHSKPELTDALHHCVVSHYYTAEGTEARVAARDGLAGGFAGECRMLGTRDYSAMLSVPTAITFYNDIGGDEVVPARNRALVLQAARMLAAAWGTRLGVPESMVGSTCMVGLPAVLGRTREDGQQFRIYLRCGSEADPSSASPLVRAASGGRCDSMAVQVPVPATDGGCLYLRISAAVYNEAAQYEVLRDVVLEMVANTKYHPG